MRSNSVDLSIVILPNDGYVHIHKTMRSVMSAVGMLEKNAITSEIVIIINHDDYETRKYCERYSVGRQAIVVSDKDDILRKLNGRYIGMVVAGDLVTKKWFIKAMGVCKLFKKNVVVRPEKILYFNDRYECKLREQYDELNTLLYRERLCGLNDWSLSCVLSLKTLKKCIRRKVEKYNCETQYFFDLELGKAGVRSIVVPGTAYFQRLRLNSCKKRDTFLIYDDFFDVKRWQRMMREMGLKEKRMMRKLKKELYVKKDDDAGSLTVWLTKDISKTFSKLLVDEWKEVAIIEPALYPFEWRMARTEVVDLDKEKAVGEVYAKIIKEVTKLPDYVFIVPWLVPGGAEKVLLNYIEALSRIHPDWIFAVITTLKKNNTWMSKLPKNAYLLDFGNYSVDLDEVEKSILFGRLLVQLGSRKLHLINSRYGYDWVADNIEYVKRNFDLNASVFCYDYVDEERREAIFDYADPYLININTAVKTIMTDNYANKIRLVNDCGFDEGKIKVHYQPINPKMKEINYNHKGKLKVLWASRIAYQKCPDILHKIARMLDPELFQIDVYGSLEDYDVNYFDGLKSLKYMGEFDGFESIGADKYDVYLYTSAIDGVPNCILEAITAGLPIIAPDVGGISEIIINNKTGILVNAFGDVEGFKKALDYARRNPEKMAEYAKSAQQLVRRQHSWDEFIKTIKRDFR